MYKTRAVTLGGFNCNFIFSQTDGIHADDDVRPGRRSSGVEPILYSNILIQIFYIEALSEAVKILKAEYLMAAIDEHKMDQAILFCRTKLDCDNLERYLCSRGGG